jgi:hypothetical protein
LRVFKRTRPSQARVASKGRLAKGTDINVTNAPTSGNHEAAREHTRARTVAAARSTTN